MKKNFYEFFIYNECGVMIYYKDFITDNNDFINRMLDEKEFKNRV
jgi:hypothetical protein